MIQGLLDFLCWIGGHKFQPTGLAGCRMAEVQCDYCGRYYVLHEKCPGVLVESDHELRELMRGRFP